MGAVIKKFARTMYHSKAEVIKNAPQNFFEIEARELNGKTFKFKELQNKKAILIVNVASGCQLTNRNYRELNELYKEFRSKGLEILCFPCNQFYNREPRCNADIEKYLKEQFMPEFKVFEKIDCNGTKAHEAYKYLRMNCSEFKSNKNKSIKRSVFGNDEEEVYKPIPLTFSKFLLDKNGKVVHYYEPLIFPSSFRNDIVTLLNVSS